MNSFKLKLLYAGLAVTLVVLIIGVTATAFHLPYASTIIWAALAAIGVFTRAIAVVLTQSENHSQPKGKQNSPISPNADKSKNKDSSSGTQPSTQEPSAKGNQNPPVRPNTDKSKNKDSSSSIQPPTQEPAENEKCLVAEESLSNLSARTELKRALPRKSRGQRIEEHVE